MALILVAGLVRAAMREPISDTPTTVILQGIQSLAVDSEEHIQESSMGAEGIPMKLRLFSEEQVEAFGARALDGSPSGYYFRAGSQSDSWDIWLDGGGLCISAKDCKKRANTTKGTSTLWLPNSTGRSNVLDANASYNPFGNWNHVRVPYGSGDVYIGTQRTASSDGLYFAGHNTLEAIVSDLKNRSGLSSARQVLFSGASAGGIGVFQNADWLGKQLPADAVYRASPQCGAFFTNAFIKLYAQFETGILNGSHRFPGLDPGLDAVSFMADYLVTWYGGVSGPHPVHMDQSCMAAMPVLERHTCWSAAVHYPFIDTPLFVAQNRFDKNQCAAVLGLNWWRYPKDNATHARVEKAYKAYFGRQTAAGIGAAVRWGPKNTTDGLFMPSCYEHGWNLCMLKNSSVIQGVRYSAALDDWFHNRGKVPHILFDDCNDKEGTDDPCNSNCGCYFDG